MSTGGSLPFVPRHQDGSVGPWPLTLFALFRSVCLCVCIISMAVWTHFSSKPLLTGYIGRSSQLYKVLLGLRLGVSLQVELSKRPKTTGLVVQLPVPPEHMSKSS